MERAPARSRSPFLPVRRSRVRPGSAPAVRLTLVIDLLLLLMAVFWGTNYAIVKHAFREIDPQAFNALRMIAASLIFLVVMVVVRASAAWPPRRPAACSTRRAAVTARDCWELAGLGLVGHCSYRYCFMAGLSRTSVANSSLIIGATPVLVALLSALLRARADRPAALDGGRAVAGRHLSGRRPGLRARVARRDRRSADVHRGVLLGDLHPRGPAADAAPLAGRRHRHVDHRSAR